MMSKTSATKKPKENQALKLNTLLVWFRQKEKECDGNLTICLASDGSGEIGYFNWEDFITIEQWDSLEELNEIIKSPAGLDRAEG